MSELRKHASFWPHLFFYKCKSNEVRINIKYFDIYKENFPKMSTSNAMCFFNAN